MQAMHSTPCMHSTPSTCAPPLPPCPHPSFGLGTLVYTVMPPPPAVTPRPLPPTYCCRADGVTIEDSGKAPTPSDVSLGEDGAEPWPQVCVCV